MAANSPERFAGTEFSKTESFKPLSRNWITGLESRSANYLPVQFEIEAKKHSADAKSAAAKLKAELAESLPKADANVPESRETSPEALEKTNFRIDSAGWKTEKLADGTRVKRNPEGDVTELVEGEFAGEQFFSQDAALRETAKAGKRMPTKDEWAAVFKAINPDVDPEGGWQDAPSLVGKLNLKLAGFRNGASDAHGLRSKYGFYWSSSPSGPVGYFILVSASRVRPANIALQTAGYSVRCFKE